MNMKRINPVLIFIAIVSLVLGFICFEIEKESVLLGMAFHLMLLFWFICGFCFILLGLLNLVAFCAKDYERTKDKRDAQESLIIQYEKEIAQKVMKNLVRGQYDIL